MPGLTQTQLIERHGGLGASDAAAALGFSKWKSPVELWMEKTADKPPEWVEPTKQQLTGIELEDALAQMCMKINGIIVQRRNNAFHSPAHPWQLAHIDRQVVGEPAVLEIKTASQWVASDWDDGVPFPYQLQAHHIMAANRRIDQVFFVALVGGIYQDGFERPELVIERDDYEIATLTDLEREFWEEHVLAKVEPPIKTIQEVAARFPQSKSATTVTATEQQIAQHVELLSVRAEMKGLKERKDEHELEFKKAIGDAEGLVDTVGDTLITWKSGKDGGAAINWEDAAGAFKQLLIENGVSLERIDLLTQAHTHKKTTGRRFLVKG